MLGPYRTQNVQATLDTLWINDGIKYRLAKEESDGKWTKIWVEPYPADVTEEAETE